MDGIPLSALWAAPEPLDEAAEATPTVDRYCSSARWVLPAHAAFHTDNLALVLRSDAGFAAFCRGEAPSIGRYLAPLESTWGLACPLVGRAPGRLARDFCAATHARRESWDTLWIGGLQRDSEMFHTLASLLSTTCELRWGPTTKRYAASLAGGYPGWLGRRSAKFRANLRRARRAAERAGVEVVPWGEDPGADPDRVYRRILAIEAKSWKGREDVGITSGAMREFYAKTLSLLLPRGALRALVATLGGRDVGYVFGGLLGRTYRGLQVSFDEAHRRLQLGNVLQAHMIERLAAEGITSYDLGSEIDYKARWSEPGITTVTLVALRR